MKNMKFKSLFYGLCLLAIILSNGCAPSARIPITKPAEVNLKGVNKIVIGSLEGNSGKSFGDLLTNRLFESKKFEVLDRDNLGRVMSEHSLNASGAVDTSTAVELGKLIGASALIAGNVNLDYKVNNSKDNPYKDKKGNYHQRFVKEGTATINANLKVIDLQTGKIVATKAINAHDSDTVSEDNQWPSDPDRDAVASGAASKSLDVFMKMIAPYTDYVYVVFEETPESEGGVNFAKNGLWKEALEQFKIAKDKNPSHPGSWYNLGLGYQYNYMFREAEDAFKECNKVKPSDKCMSGISELRRMEQEQKKLQEQSS